MDRFLVWVGLYNVVGSLVVVAMTDVRIADAVMRRGTEMASQPYVHGPFERLWIWWAGAANLFLGAVMLLATRWPPVVQREVCMAVVAMYAVMYVVCVVGGRRRPPWGRGVYSLHVLWPAQMAWGIWALSAP